MPLPASGTSSLRLLVGAIPFAAQDDYCAPLFAGIREEAAAHGVDIAYHMPGIHNGGAVPDAKTVQQMQAQAVLTVSWGIDDLPRVLALREAGIPFVAIGLRSRAHHLPLVSTDNFEGMRTAVQHLQAAGHRTIAYTTINIQNSDVLERLSGFQFQIAQNASPVDPMYLQVSHWRREPTFLEAWWHSMDPKPTALILDGTDAPALLVVLAREGARIPDDVSIILIDDIQSLRYFTPRLTVLRQPTYDLGRRGLAKLVAMLHGDDDGAPVVLPAELVEGDSVRDITPEPSAMTERSWR
jgi:DNA-binding LacI/PurR family transcriptional regulator